MLLVLDSTLLAEQPEWTASFEELVDLEGDGTWRGRVSGDLHIAVATDRVRIIGSVGGSVPRECHLCLAHYLEDVSAKVVELCEIGEAASASAVFDEDDEVWRVAPEGRIDLTEMVRQAVILALPTRADCEQCPEAERSNVGQAGTPGGDPRWAVLRNMLKSEDDDGSPEEAR